MLNVNDECAEFFLEVGVGIGTSAFFIVTTLVTVAAGVFGCIILYAMKRRAERYELGDN